MTPEEIKAYTTEKLDKLLPSHVFLDRMRLIDEASRKTSAYTDPKYVPFYYHLGNCVQPKTMVELGFRLGLFSACFLTACKSVERFLAFQQQTREYYSPKLGRANVRDRYKKQFFVYVGNLTDDEFEALFQATSWDLAIINEEVTYDQHRAFLDLLWPQMSDEGLIVMDYVVRHRSSAQAYADFCRAQNRAPCVVETRYGVGLIQK